jgi:hypothetical protein
MNDPVVLMAAYGWQLNRLERWLFWLAALLAGLLVAARLGTIVIVSYLHYHR